IRSETVDDAADIRAIHTLAFGRDNEARLVDALRAEPGFDPALSLVAIADGHAVGHILFSPILIRASHSSVPALALAPLAVRPEFQNHSVGSTLVRAGLEECRRLGHTVVVVVGHPHYYPRFGFSSARAAGLEAPFPVSDAAFMALELAPGALYGVRGMIEYPAPFADV